SRGASCARSGPRNATSPTKPPSRPSPPKPGSMPTGSSQGARLRHRPTSAIPRRPWPSACSAHPGIACATRDSGARTDSTCWIAPLATDNTLRAVQRQPLVFHAACPHGLEEALAEELRRLGASTVPARGGVGFEGDLALAYRAN